MLCPRAIARRFDQKSDSSLRESVPSVKKTHLSQITILMEVTMLSRTPSGSVAHGLLLIQQRNNERGRAT
jgi:hypothetical protein